MGRDRSENLSNPGEVGTDGRRGDSKQDADFLGSAVFTEVEVRDRALPFRKRAKPAVERIGRRWREAGRERRGEPGESRPSRLPSQA